MSSIHEIDPRLRSVASEAFSQHPANTTHPTPIAANINASISPIPQHQQQQYQPIQAHDGSPHHNIYLPHTPQSAGHITTDQDGAFDNQDDGPNDPKRPRACEACRGLKVRCEPDPNNPDGPCKRCAKATRNCVVTVPSRKRQKKTDSRVAELEKKIDALTQTLLESKSAPSSTVGPNGLDGEGFNGPARHGPYQQVTNGTYGSPYLTRPDTRGNEWSEYPKRPEFQSKDSAPPMVVAGQKRKHMENREYSTVFESPNEVGGQHRKSIDSSEADSFPPFYATPFTGPKPPQTHQYQDVIDRGTITTDMATMMFDCYVERMSPHMPVVVFPTGTTAAEVRRTKPIVFLAILSASSGTNYPELQRILTKEVMSIYADRIICNGEKTLELIQALHISTLWYWPPEHFEELKFYQLIHIAAVMALDIGIGKKTKSQKGKNAGLWRDHAWRRTPYPDPETLEARRAWLGCYFQCCNASMGLRRPNLIRWSPFMADCIEVLETSPDAAPTDKALCQWVRSQHIAEEIGTQFSMDDPVASVSIADAKVQYALKGFERDLDQWSSRIPPEARSRSLKMTEHVVNLYMHEVAMHVDHNVDEFKPPFTEETLKGIGEGSEPKPLSHAHIGALSTCLTSIDGIFETFLSYDVDTVRCLPVASFVRVAYAVVVLIKMYFAASTPNSELGKVINKDNMKVEQYLDGLVEIFRASSAEEKSRPSGKFLMVLTMLKAWFHHQREGKPGPSTKSTATSTIPSDTPAEALGETSQNPNARGGQKSDYSPPTSLQLLSEVATNNSRGQPRSEGQYPEPSNEWQQHHHQQQQPQEFQGYGSMNPMAMQQPFMGGNIDPSLGMDLGYTMGDGMEQAMGLTLGGFGDFGQYFSDDSFFTGLVDPVAPGGSGFDGF